MTTDTDAPKPDLHPGADADVDAIAGAPRRGPRRGAPTDGVALVAATIVAVGVALLAVGQPPILLVAATAGAFIATRRLGRAVTVRRRAAVVDLTTHEAPMVPTTVLDAPIRPNRITGTDVVEMALAAAVAFAIAEIVRIVVHIQSTMSLGIWWYGAFLALLFVLVRERLPMTGAIDRVMTVVIWSVGALVSAALVWMLVFVTGKGISKLSRSFLTEDLAKVGPLTPGGGAQHAIVGTFVQVGLATAIVVPIAVLTAVYLNEIKGVLARPVRFIVDAMSGLPSIVAGLLVFTVWVDGRGYSGIAATMALIVLMLPTVTRASEEILRTVADALREGALALGAPRWRVAQRIVLPTARAGLVTAVLLGVARAVGETAPMLLTAFGSDRTVVSPVNGPQSDLPLFVWKLIRQPNETQNARAWTGALVLVMLVLVLFTTARFVTNRGQRKLGRSL